MKSHVWFLKIVLFVALLSLLLPIPAIAKKAKHVLVLHSYHSGMSWVTNIEKGIRETLLVPPFDDLILHIEYMDTKRNYSEEHYTKLQELLEEKFKNTPLSLILSSDNNAFDFLLKRRKTLFPDIPVVFCGVNNFSEKWLEGVPNFTGVAEIMSSRETVEAILKQLPETKEIYIINDYLKTGRAWQSTISRNLKPFEEKVSVKYNDNLSIEDLRTKIQSMKPGSVVLMGVYYSDRDGKYLTYEKLGTMLTHDSPVPVYCLLRFNLRDGVVGGKVISGYHQGVMMSEIARRALSDEKIKNLPVAKVGANAFIFDWRGMKKNNISISSLPPESIIINEPFSFYEEYIILVWSTIFVFTAMSVLVFILIRNITTLKAVRKELSNSELKYRSIFDNAQEGIFQTTYEGKVLSANSAFAAMFGYDSIDEIIERLNCVGKDLYAHENDRHKMLEIMKRDGKISKLELQMKRKNGSQIWVNLNCRKTKTPDDNHIFEGSLVDITERRNAQEELIEAIRALRINMSHMRTLLEALPELVWLKDTDGVYVFCNHRFEKFFGATEAQIVGKTDYDFIDKDLADFFREKDLLATKVGKPSINEETVTYAEDGHVEELETIKTPMYVEGQLVGILGVARDITMRKKAEKELDRLRNYMLNIINSMPSILVGVDKHGYITLWNKTAEEVTGVSPKSAHQKLLTDVLPRIKPAMDSVAESISTRTPKRRQRIPYHIDDGTRYEDITIYPLITDEDEGAVVRIDDVTDRINIEQMMVQSEKMMSVGGLAAGMAHEINNPLAVIIGSAQNLQNRLTRESSKNFEVAGECGCSFPAIKDYIEKRGCMKMLQGMHEAGLRAANIVKSMLSFSRKSDKELYPHNPKDLVESSLNLAMNDYDFKKNYDFRKIEVVREYGHDVPVVQCDGTEIQQVLLNLLKNGAEAMAEKEYQHETPKFVLRTHTSDSMAVIEIEDNGPGMSENVRKRILEPFYTTKPVGSGTGLGLSISYFIITDRHKGSMEVLSKPGEWTRFVIKLPAYEKTQ